MTQLADSRAALAPTRAHGAPAEALASMRALLHAGGDEAYFRFHEHRYRRHLGTLAELGLLGRPTLDIGSHYLHLAGSVRLMGSEVTALDVPAFQEIPWIAERAARLGIRTATVGDLGAGDFLADVPDASFDVVLFCEIIEHVTFNPVRFWRRVHELLRPGGVVYLTTPNALRLANLLKTLHRAVTLEGVGIPVAHIFEHVTYGHHWKEYGARELVDYFARLSPDFAVEVRPYACRQGDGGSATRRLVRRVGNLVPALREQLEVLVRLPAKTPWRTEPRGYDA
jgi:2-polyprenyl-6-hydroxyphenyl methylase/3-demethylubiquinone-9 3-methyltransferase